LKTLSDRALNRATLARQCLLDRRGSTVLDAVTWFVGLQAQEPGDPYVALWSRLDPFDPHELGALLESRQVVRITVMRGTIHLVTADDALALRPLMQPVLDAEGTRHPDVRQLDDQPLTKPLALARRLVDERPRTPSELRAAFEREYPEAHAPGLTYACRLHLPLVQVPPRGVWGKRGMVRLAHAESWLGRSLDHTATLDDVVLRYLRAFGPATVADVNAWCRLTGLRAVVERLRPQLRTLNDARGRELFDVPDGPLPDEDVPAPVRFLPEYDNALLSHRDRSRFFVDDERARVGAHEERIKGTVLYDGFVRATWRWDGDDVVVSHVPRLPKTARRDIVAEGEQMLTFLERDGDVRLSGVGES
jgi:hypothetical protein